MRIATTLIVGTVVLAAVGCSSARSVEAFCDNLDEGEQRLAAVSAEAHQQTSPLASFVVAFGGFGEFERLLDDLADSAPDEIRQDMERTRDVFAEQTAPIDDVSASRILGQLSANLSTSLMNAPAFLRVDEFATTNCGSPVFGFASVAEAFSGETATADAPSATEPVEELCPDQPAPVEAGAPVTRLESALSAAAEVDVASANQLAEQLAEHTDLPSDALEALAHLRWRFPDVDFDQQLTDLNTETLDACGQPAVSDELLDAFENRHPQPTENGGTFGTYGREGGCTSFDLLDLDGDHIIWDCSGMGTVVMFDTSTGALEVHKSRGSDTPPALSGGHVFWVEHRETPASGLQSATTEYALVRSDGPGQPTEDIRIWDDVEYQPALEGGGGGHLLVRIDRSGEVIDLDGTTQMELPGRMSNAYHLFDTVYQLSGTHDDRDRSHVLDLRTLELTEMYGSGGETDVCHGLYGSYVGSLQVQSDGSMQVHQLDVPLNTNTRPVEGGLVQHASGGGIERLTVDGQHLWHIPGDVIGNWRVFAGQVIIRTSDGMTVGVNADSGEEEPLRGGTSAEAFLNQSSIVVDHTTGEVVTHGPERGTFTRETLPDCQVRSDG